MDRLKSKQQTLSGWDNQYLRIDLDFHLIDPQYYQIPSQHCMVYWYWDDLKANFSGFKLVDDVTNEPKEALEEQSVVKKRYEKILKQTLKDMMIERIEEVLSEAGLESSMVEKGTRSLVDTKQLGLHKMMDDKQYRQWCQLPVTESPTDYVCLSYQIEPVQIKQALSLLNEEMAFFKAVIFIASSKAGIEKELIIHANENKLNKAYQANFQAKKIKDLPRQSIAMGDLINNENLKSHALLNEKQQNSQQHGQEIGEVAKASNPSLPYKIK